jgi:cobalt-zinc-cadmium efflux system membrane fusion protein
MKYKKLIAITVAVLLVIGVLVYMVVLNVYHEGHDHANPVKDESGNEGSGQSQRVSVTQEQVARLGIKITRATRGIVRREIRAPGEIKVNADRMAHIVPRIPGVVVEVRKKLGDTAKAGEVMAVIRSRALADAKAGYLAAIERYDLAKTIFEREEKLWKEKISSEQDYLDAKKEFSDGKIQLRSIRQKLHALGFSKYTLEKLPLEKEDQLTNFEITAPFDGTVIDKHITLGEVVGDDAEVFVVADLSSVWVDLVISQDTISSVQEEHTVRVRLPDGSESETTIEFISPLIAPDTRSALARATLPNPNGRFRPGTFVDAGILVPSKEETVVVPKASVQLVNDHPCVFVWGKADFELRAVETGMTDGLQIEILQGLRPGEAVASENAFHLKAEFVKSAGGDSGGHGHAH